MWFVRPHSSRTQTNLHLGPANKWCQSDLSSQYHPHHHYHYWQNVARAQSEHCSCISSTHKALFFARFQLRILKWPIPHTRFLDVLSPLSGIVLFPDNFICSLQKL